MSPTDEGPGPLAVFGGLASWSIIAAMAFAVAAWPIAERLGGSDQVLAAMVGLAVALAGSLIGSVIPAAAIRQPPQTLAMAMLGDIMARFFVMLMPAIVLRDVVGGNAMLAWLALAQLVLLVVDVAALVRVAKKRTTRIEAKC
ncbi:MAG: hypothetical protein ACKVS9_15700 [Phycisphaerae bacterium]